MQKRFESPSSKIKMRPEPIQIRMNRSDAQVVFAHADHVHNIPSMLIDFHPDQLRPYRESDRLCFLELLPQGNNPLKFSTRSVNVRAGLSTDLHT